MNLSHQNIHQVLALLGEHMAQSGVKPTRLIVCGGTALNVLNLVIRTTKDVDVIGSLGMNEQWDHDLPKELWDGVYEVGQFFKLPKDWLNLGPQSYLETGLPEGLIQRLTWRSYGSVLQLGYISRYDQVHFKLYASADRAGYHVDDLLLLKPTSEEIIEASKWCMSQDVSIGFRTILISMLNQLGFKAEAEEL